MTQRGDSVEHQFTDGLRLRASFLWRDDRYSHCVTLIDRHGETAWLESIEGSSQDAWPPSPAFQQLSMQGEGPQRVALLVGMAGKSHWSMSVEGSQEHRGLIFDVACRVNTAAGPLGSTYRAGEFQVVDATTAVSPESEQRCAIVLDPTLPADSQALAVSTSQLRIEHLAAATAIPYTARWKYAVTRV